MKHTIKNSLAALLLLAMGVVGCSKDNTLPENPDNTNIPMSMTITDEGYTDSDPTTRTSELDYETKFTNGDHVGVYVVKNGAIVNDNVQFSYNESTGKWTGDLTFYEGPEAKYFAYYPYNKDQKSGNLNLAANTATEFFASVISAWTPSTDQGDYHKYRVNDLMIGKATAKKEDGKFTLSLNMTHAMAMVIMELPGNYYKFNNDPKIDDYSVSSVREEVFHGFTPYFTGFNTYRLLVKPNQTESFNNLVGRFTNAKSGTKKEYSVVQNGIEGGKYKRHLVDGGVKVTDHNLRPGDLYLKDGLLVPYDRPITPEEKAACIGIVFWAGNPAATDNILREDKKHCTRGLVVALGEGGKISWQNSKTVDVQGWLNKNQNRSYQPVGSGSKPTDPINNVQGYNNTKAFEYYNSRNAMSIAIPIQNVGIYRKNVPAPQFSSDWYIPSAKELTIMLSGKHNPDICNTPVSTASRDLINQKIQNVGGDKLTNEDYWSTTEFDGAQVFVNFNNGRTGYTQKSMGFRTRYILAF